MTCDTIDIRIVNDVLNKTGRSIATTADQPEGGWPELNSLPAPLDDDHDGMPNDWELANGLVPSDPADRNNINQDGYTMLEVYLNSLTGEVDDDASYPQEFVLHQNYPNPFNLSTTISFQLPDNSHTKLKIYNFLGQEVAVLVDGMRPAGIYKVQFDGSGLPNGIYFVTFRTGLYTKTTKILLIK